MPVGGIVTVAMGSPKQEMLMHDCGKVHPRPLYMGLGGTYDVFTGCTQGFGRIWVWSGFTGCSANLAVFAANLSY